LNQKKKTWKKIDFSFLIRKEKNTRHFGQHFAFLLTHPLYSTKCSQLKPISVCLFQRMLLLRLVLLFSCIFFRFSDGSFCLLKIYDFLSLHSFSSFFFLQSFLFKDICIIFSRLCLLKYFFFSKKNFSKNEIIFQIIAEKILFLFLFLFLFLIFLNK